MIRRLARCIREYKWAAMLSPLCMVGEVTMEVLIPLVMANLYDYGVQLQDMHIVVTRSIQLVICAVMSLCFGVMSAVFASRAGTGFAKNLRHDDLPDDHPYGHPLPHDAGSGADLRPADLPQAQHHLPDGHAGADHRSGKSGPRGL